MVDLAIILFLICVFFKFQEFEKVAGPPAHGAPQGLNPGMNRRRGGGGRVGGQQDPSSPDTEVSVVVVVSLSYSRMDFFEVYWFERWTKD